MNAIASPTRSMTSPALRPAGWLAESLQRQRALVIFGLLLWAAMLPTFVAWGLDDRTLRGVGVWVKPLKFMASVGLFAISTAWFIGLLPEARRLGRGVRLIVWTVIVAGTFEIAYITLQASLGAGSHFNFVDLPHIVMYQLMGLAALAMTATQPWLAWQIARHGRTDAAPAWRDAVVLGLVLTFVLGAAAGGLLASHQPPAGPGLPVVGWHLGGADLRPAHFIGMHAQQLFPLAGLALADITPRRSRAALAAFGLAYIGVWCWAMWVGIGGAVLTVPTFPSR